MAEMESASVETSEVAEPTEEVTGVEEQETAEPVSEETVEEPKKTEEDAAWARMRREAEAARAEAEAAQRELEELRAANEARQSTYSRLTGSDDGIVAAIAEATGMSEDEVRAEIEASEEAAAKDMRIAQLEEQLTSITAERIMQEDLQILRKIDPSLKSLTDLGEEYMRYVTAINPETGEPFMTPEDAYWAVKAKEQANRATPPVEVGKVATGTVEHELTDAEIDAMSSEQLTKNWKNIMAKWDKDAQR